MGRTGDINSKTISVRVPMETYINFLQSAVDRRLSMSEYMSIRIMADPEADKKRIEELEESVNAFNVQKAQFEADLMAINERIAKAEAEAGKNKESASKALKSHSENEVVLRNEIKQLKTQISELKKALEAKEKQNEELGNRVNAANTYLKSEAIFGSPKQF